MSKQSNIIILLMISVLTFLCLISCCYYAQSIPPTTLDELAYAERVKSQPIVFFISKEEEKVVWGRAQSWINKYSSMAIRFATDFVVETFHPYNEAHFGYSITKTPKENGFEITVKCIVKRPSVSGRALQEKHATRNLHILVYYMQTGEIMPKFIYGIP